jgi:hypothetical protein
VIARVRAALHAPRDGEREWTEQERALVLAAIAEDRARRRRWQAVGNVLLACCFLLLVVVAVALRLF